MDGGGKRPEDPGVGPPAREEGPERWEGSQASAGSRDPVRMEFSGGGCTGQGRRCGEREEDREVTAGLNRGQ